MAGVFVGFNLDSSHVEALRRKGNDVEEGGRAANSACCSKGSDDAVRGDEKAIKEEFIVRVNDFVQQQRRAQAAARSNFSECTVADGFTISIFQTPSKSEATGSAAAGAATSSFVSTSPYPEAVHSLLRGNPRIRILSYRTLLHILKTLSLLHPDVDYPGSDRWKSWWGSEKMGVLGNRKDWGVGPGRVVEKKVVGPPKVNEWNGWSGNILRGEGVSFWRSFYSNDDDVGKGAGSSSKRKVKNNKKVKYLLPPSSPKQAPPPPLDSSSAIVRVSWIMISKGNPRIGDSISVLPSRKYRSGGEGVKKRDDGEDAGEDDCNGGGYGYGYVSYTSLISGASTKAGEGYVPLKHFSKFTRHLQVVSVGDVKGFKVKVGRWDGVASFLA